MSFFIYIDDQAIKVEWENAGKLIPRCYNGVKRIIKKNSMALKRQVQKDMPVATGRAKASWGNVPAPPPAFPDDGIWEVLDDGFTIRQGSRVEYIQALNDGTSLQAPAGFIDAAEAEAVSTAEEELADLVDKVFGVYLWTSLSSEIEFD